MAWHAGSFKVSLLWAVCCLLWLGISLIFGHELSNAVLPLLRWELSGLIPQYKVTELNLVSMGLDMSVQARVTTREAIIISGHTLPAGTPLQSSTLVGHLWQPLIVMLSLVNTAALTQRRNTVALIPLCLATAGLLLMLDVPFVLVGALQDLLAPEHFSAWVVWMNFLNGGGRLALGIGAALLVLTPFQSRATGCVASTQLSFHNKK